MTDSEIPTNRNRCHLEWDHANRRAVLGSLEVLETYQNDVHECQQLMRCKDCGQLYFCDWQEVVRFDDDFDSQDYVLIPVADGPAAQTLSQQSRLSRGGLPALVMIWPPEDAKPYWVNR